MTKWQLLSGLVVVAAACGGETAGVSDRTAPIINGTVDTGDQSVVGIYYPESPGSSFGFICTGMVVAPRVVLTAAHCVHEAIEGGFPDAGYIVIGHDMASPIRTIDTVDAFEHRYYDPLQVGQFDVAMILLAEDAGVPSLPLNDQPLGEVLEVGDEVRAVGYGSNQIEPMESGAGTKRQANLEVISIAPRHILMGQMDDTTCHGDSGGPSFVTVGGVEKIVGVHSYGRNCTGNGTGMRVDAFLDDFIYIAMDAWDGPCRIDGTCVTDGCRSPDPDCDPCGPEGTCAADCPQVDWDCPIGGRVGETCAESTDCESRLCRPADDDPRILYCSATCDPANPSFDCGDELQCTAVGGENICLYPLPTPGAQGSPCSTGADCRSTLCDLEYLICVEECDPGAADSCPENYECSPSSLAPHVCRPPSEGGGCAIAPRGGGVSIVSRGGGVSIVAMVFLCAVLAFAFTRRRR